MYVSINHNSRSIVTEQCTCMFLLTITPEALLLNNVHMFLLTITPEALLLNNKNPLLSWELGLRKTFHSSFNYIFLENQKIGTYTYMIMYM